MRHSHSSAIGGTTADRRQLQAGKSAGSTQLSSPVYEMISVAHSSLSLKRPYRFPAFTRQSTPCWTPGIRSDAAATGRRPSAAFTPARIHHRARSPYPCSSLYSPRREDSPRVRSTGHRPHRPLMVVLHAVEVMPPGVELLVLEGYRVDASCAHQRVRPALRPVDIELLLEERIDGDVQREGRSRGRANAQAAIQVEAPWAFEEEVELLRLSLKGSGEVASYSCAFACRWMGFAGRHAAGKPNARRSPPKSKERQTTA
jgi:hypothetical protein